MKKTKKSMLVAGLASALLLGMCSSAMAATIYVGNTGFDLDRVLNDPAYETAFKNYLEENIANELFVDFDDNGSAVNTDDFLNSNEGQTLLEFELTNETVQEGTVWDGTGEPGETQNILVDVSTKEGLAGIAFGVKVIFPANVTSVKVTSVDGDVQAQAITLIDGIYKPVPGTYAAGANVIVFEVVVGGVTKTETITK